MSSEPAAVPPSDQQLAREAQQGSVAGFEELVRRYQVPLLHFLRNRTRSTADAEDLVQDTLVRAYENLYRYRPPYRFSTWLFTIAHRISLNERRKRRPSGGPDGIESVPARGAGPEAAAIEKEQRGRLWDLAATSLSQPQMTALWLYYVEEMPVAEIAKVLERSRVATKTMLFRARRKLKPLLAAMERAAMEPDVVGREQGTSAQSSRPIAVEISNG
jgi:RNA polymerase sigma-70 factor (ECF subfamily)